VVLGVAAVGAVLWSRDSPAGGGPPGGSTSTAQGGGAGLDGFVACGPAYCPTRPICWAGLNLVGGVAQPIRRLDCAESHAWETFAAGHLPADAALGRQDALIQRPEIASACSESMLADRSLDTARTDGWQREPWPILVSGDAWVFHCVSAPVEGGERTGSDFRVG
jgi:serine/threonine-protein kinase